MSINQIDNPGKGDCGYYAFAIGLIEHIQRESRENAGQSRLLDKWRALDASLSAELADEIKTFNLHKMAREPHHYHSALLQHLQQSLRNICFDQQIRSVNAEPFHSKLYADFYALVLGQGDQQFNVLANSAEVRQLANRVADKSNTEYIKSIFLSDIQNPEISKIYAAAACVTRSGVWATERELFALAEVFDLSAKITTRAQPRGFIVGQDEGKPMITLHNQGNFHWVTKLQQPICGPAPIQEKSAAVRSRERHENYRQLIQALFIDKAWQTKPITTNHSGYIEHETDATFLQRKQQIQQDEALARKLQAEELRDGGEDEAKKILSSFRSR